MTGFIRVQPARRLRVPFARWAVAQQPKVRTVSADAFAVPADLFTHMPEELLIGSLVDGQRYVSPDEEERGTEAAGPDAPELLGVDTPRLLACGLCYEENGQEVHPHPECTMSGPREAVPGRPLPEAPATGYGPDSVPLPPPVFAPLEDAPTNEDQDQGAGEDGPPFPCGLCDRELNTARGRDAHRRQVHGQGARRAR